jgi:hypothetical protein
MSDQQNQQNQKDDQQWQQEGGGGQKPQQREKIEKPGFIPEGEEEVAAKARAAAALRLSEKQFGEDDF